MKQNQTFMQLLASRGILTADAGARLLQTFDGDAFSVLCHLAKIHPHRKAFLGRLWGDSIGISYVDTSKTLFQRDVLLKLPEEFARKHRIVLLYEFGEALTAAMTDPTNQAVLREAQRITGRIISPVFSLPEDIETAVELEYQSEDQLSALSSKIVTESVVISDITNLTRDELQNIAGDQGVVEFVKGLLLLAVRQRASDVHVEPGEEKVRVRFRIDGVLQEKSTLEKALLAPVLSRLKILSNLDITEKRKPQDGRISLTLPNRTVDLRFSSIPTIYGEKAVLRVLGDSRAQDIPDLVDLSFSSSNLKAVKRVVDTPYGIFFVTGPTGSGKTTTLFAMLKHLNKPGKNVTTIEDPIEYRL
ncbi:MAG: ATPase, T2SS/T4P/T4SS family, partial [Syntrophobacteraceae bacterium]